MSKTLALLVLIILILIFLRLKTPEHFDTYYNHDYGAYDVYKNEDLPVKTVNDAALKAKYQWSERDKMGDTVYEKMYDAAIMQKNNTDYEYAYRDTDLGLDNVYDSKFTVLNNENEYSNYNVKDMYDPNIVQTFMNNEAITLIQKQY